MNHKNTMESRLDIIQRNYKKEPIVFRTQLIQKLQFPKTIKVLRKMISQFLIFLSFVLQAAAQQETTQAAEETTTAKFNTGLSDSHLFYTVYES